MKILLDTHTALWFVNEYEKLSPKAKNILLNDTNQFYISVVSVREVAIKVSIGKMSELIGGAKTFLNKIEETPINIISISSNHAAEVESLPFIHNDPFDRLLIATAKSEVMTILTADENIHKYDVDWMW
ncbi:MAG: type II toxin-antitoxin system VapC family toxin [Fibromonadaceae bacterium]|jgi:PIN domain nuclease of toxin-antitoxin system|nr:type II toxin-antitoxin system VapC family toxin [Fibromonadaceae bacterium]